MRKFKSGDLVRYDYDPDRDAEDILELLPTLKPGFPLYAHVSGFGEEGAGSTSLILSEDGESLVAPQGPGPNDGMCEVELLNVRGPKALYLVAPSRMTLVLSAD